MTAMSLSSVAAVRRLQTGLLLALCGITLTVFGGVCGHEFVHYDDAGNIYANPHLKGLNWESIKWMFTDVSYARRYMPLGWMSYAVDYEFFGLSPRAYHLGNLLLHCLNVVLLFFLVKRVLLLARPPLKAGEADGTSVWCAALAALFWAVNPLRVETVAWASSRIYGVVGLLTLFWLLAWLRAQDASTPEGWQRVFYWLSVVAYGASLLTYPLALFAPVGLLVVEIVLRHRLRSCWVDWWSPPARRLWRQMIPFLALAVGGLVLTFLARVDTDLSHRPPTLGEFSLLSRVMQAFYIWMYYVWKPWVPYDLAASYTALHSFNPLEPKFLVSAFLVVTISLALWQWRRRWTAALGFWVCHLVLLVPCLGLTEYPHCAYDRYSYLPGLLWALGLAMVLRLLWDRATRGYLAGVTTAVVSALFALLAWQQVPIWSDTITLYRHLVASIGEHPNRSRFDEVLGVQYLLLGLTNEAAAAFRSAIYYEHRRADRHLYDEGILTRVNLRLGDLSADRGEFEPALTYYHEALQSDLKSVTAVIKIGLALARLNRDAEAIRCLREAVRMNPESVQAHRALAQVLTKLGQHEEAKVHFQEERRLLAGK